MECERIIIRVERNDICYIRNTLESYDGMVLVRSLDPNLALLALHVAPGCLDTVKALLESLRREGLAIFLTKEAKS